VKGSRPPDRTERRVRFVFGAAFGFLMGFFFAPRVTNSGWLAVLYIVATGIVFGFLARRYGDRFWANVWRLWWWWRQGH
jgi:uncharacterized membrane protein YccC